MWTWLSTELKRSMQSSDMSRFALDLSNQKISLIERRLNGERVLGEVGNDAKDFMGDIEELRGIVVRKRGPRAPVDLLLPEELTLFRIETLPAEARPNLREEVWWRLDMITPYQPEELFYDVSLLGVEPTTGFLDVHIVIAPRELGEEAIRYARIWGFEPQRLTTRGPVEGFPHGALFHRAANYQSETRPLRRSAALLACAALSLGVIGVVRSVQERQIIADTLDSRRVELDRALDGELAKRAQVLSLARRANEPAQRRAFGRPALSWLDALAAALPKDAKASRIIIGDGVLRLEGAADNADAVLAALESSVEFNSARYAAPVKRDGGAHRFAIEARLTQDPTKDASGDAQ